MQLQAYNFTFTHLTPLSRNRYGEYFTLEFNATTNKSPYGEFSFFRKWNSDVWYCDNEYLPVEFVVAAISHYMNNTKKVRKNRRITKKRVIMYRLLRQLIVQRGHCENVKFIWIWNEKAQNWDMRED